MISLGLSASQLRTLRQDLVKTNDLHVRANLLALDHTPLDALTDYLIDGQVDVDGTQVITRQLTMTLMDTRKHLPFDTDSPARTALFMDRMIEVEYRVVSGGDWVNIPVFTGPVTGLQRAGSIVTVTCQSKEILALGSVWPPMTIGKNIKKTTALTKVMHAAGEDDRHLDIPDLNNRLAHSLSLHRSQQYWGGATHLADSMNRQLYYDGRGVCHLRKHPKHTFSFTAEQDVLTDPEITYGAVTANTVVIVGAKPKGAKHPIVAIAVAPHNHPLSPWRLGRNGVPRHILLSGAPIHLPHIKHHDEAVAVARHRLDTALLGQVDVQFDVMPGAIALLDPNDHCHVKNEKATTPFRLQKFSLPLGEGSSASVGYHKKVSLSRTRRRGHHHHHHPKSRRHHHR